MKRQIPWLMIIVLLGFFSLMGCAAPLEVTQNGFKQAEESSSIPHPVEVEKNGEHHVTMMPMILDPGLWGVEGFSHKDLDVGIFPVITDGKIKGYAIITEANLWADQVMWAIVVGKKSDIGRVAYLSRDGHTIHDISGEEFTYDSEKFEKDANYKNQIFSAVGMTVEEIESFWRKYSEARGLEIPADFQFVEEIKVGSDRWGEFKAQLATRLTENCKMPDGQIRSGFMSLEDFRKEASKNNGATLSQRFSRGVFVPAAVDPITLGVGTVGSFLNGLIAASNGPMEGFYSMAECRRGDLKPRFREMSKNFKSLLMLRDQQIYAMQQKILQMGGTP